jgi:hypothetical protein
MDIVIQKGIVTKRFRSAKSGVDYLTVEEGNSTITLSGGDVDLSNVPLMEPLQIGAQVIGKVYEGRFSLQVTNISVKVLGQKTA